MRSSVIKHLVEHFTDSELARAESELRNRVELSIPVDGGHNGEKLTHVLAARWILLVMGENGYTLQEGLRAFAERIRRTVG